MGYHENFHTNAGGFAAVDVREDGVFLDCEDCEGDTSTLYLDANEAVKLAGIPTRAADSLKP